MIIILSVQIQIVNKKIILQQNFWKMDQDAMLVNVCAFHEKLYNIILNFINNCL